MKIKLTEYSKSSGCGCKISPSDLQEILELSNVKNQSFSENLLVGNNLNDDASVYKLSDDLLLISSVDFFSPIVNDAFDFGYIAAANAISDIYAMGAKPIIAHAILVWPIEIISKSLASEVLRGAAECCKKAGIPMAGGHSIHGVEPIFGLSVNGTCKPDELKTNAMAKTGDILAITKAIGIGALATAHKRNLLKDEDYLVLKNHCFQLNEIGSALAQFKKVHAITDITGFGLLGHLIELCEASNLKAEISFDKIPIIPESKKYMDSFVFPDNTYRNWNAYSEKVSGVEGMELVPLCDPQTNGGLLLSFATSELKNIQALATKFNQEIFVIGQCTEQTKSGKTIELN